MLLAAFCHLGAALALVCASTERLAAAPGAGEVGGVLRKWHKVSVTFTHDADLAEDSADNPFRNYRLRVLFTHPASGSTCDVPGFFAADGDAANTSAVSGRKWRVHFAPDRAGAWSYVASFRRGPDVAVDLDLSSGTPVSFDGAGGSFTVAAADPDAPGFLRQGLLAHAGERYLQFMETGERYLKGGANSPENLLGYYEFDGTFDTGSRANDLDGPPYRDGLHHFDAHSGDFRPGDPFWLGGGAEQKGRNIIGALNYLASKGMNAVYFLTYNVDGGDGGEVWPWTSPAEKHRFDVSKLAQWETVFDHMTRLGLALHVITQETENDHALDGGELGLSRKLYLRELIARFGHSLSLIWNLGEEITNSERQRRAFADYIRATDPYDHPITAHTFPGDETPVYGSFLGFASFEGASLQLSPAESHERTLHWLEASAAAGRPWFVCHDEQAPSGAGVLPDASDPGHNPIRKQALWGNLMAGGGGCEWYFGYEYPHSDLDCEDWRSRERMWDLTSQALEFFRSYLPFWEMRAADDLTADGSDYVLAKAGELYAIYLPDGGSAQLDVEESSDTLPIQWYDPRRGGALEQGSVREVTGPGRVSIGNPPDGGEDWVALVGRPLEVEPLFRRGDANLDREMDISDAISILSFLFTGDEGLACMDAADVNDDSQVDLSDPIALLDHLFRSALPLPVPSLGCGSDPTADDLSCESLLPCGGN